MKRFPVGTRAQVSDCAGLDSNKIGTVIVPVTDYRGIPKVSGAYRPMTLTGPMAERMLKTDSGEVILMFTACLREV